MSSFVRSEIEKRRAKFMACNDTTQLRESIGRKKRRLDEMADASVPDRKRNRLTREIENDRRRLVHMTQKRSLFDILSADVNDAAEIVGDRSYYVSRAHRTKDAEPVGVRDTRVILEDVLLCDDDDTVQDTIIQVDDICECGQAMRRILSLSCLVCPNPKCHHMRVYIDTSTGAMPFNSKHESNATARRKCLTHYHTYLNTIQGKSTKRFTTEYLFLLCRYCYIEGARTPEDIQKKIVNTAQSYIMKHPEYTHTPVLISLLAGQTCRMPIELENMLMAMLDYMIPVFEKYKDLLKANRSNMINFAYTTRTNLRLLGFDIFLPVVSSFVLPQNQVRHGAFMRLLYHDLGWVWDDGKIADVSDKELDEFEFREQLMKWNEDE